MNPRAPLRVLVVDDSAMNRRAIAEILDSSGIAKVVGVARDGEEGIKKAFDTRPDLITLDLEMPRMDGFTFLRIIMKSLPTPVIVISSRDEDKNVFKALELGAIDFLPKPANNQFTESWLKEEIVDKLQVVRELRFRNVQRRLGRAAVPAVPTPPPPEPEPAIQPARAVLIGASTGGPSALQSIISAMPPDLNAPVLISQHMPPGFTRAFAERLERNSNLKVKEAEDGDLVLPGTVLVAPGGKNLMVKRTGPNIRALVSDKTDEFKYVPSVDALFESGAKAFAEDCLAVVLTGMGNDGARGVRAVKEAGGQVLAESERTSVVFGMPKEAINAGVVDEILNLEDIPAAIIKRCKAGK